MNRSWDLGFLTYKEEVNPVIKSEPEGMYINIQTMEIELWIPISYNWNLKLVRLIDELELEKDRKFAEDNKMIWLVLVWITWEDWSIPKYLIDYFKDPAIIREKWCVDPVWSPEKNKKAIYMFLEDLVWDETKIKITPESATNATKQRIESITDLVDIVTMEWEWIHHTPFPLDTKTDWIYYDRNTKEISGVDSYKNPNRIVVRDIGLYLETIEEVELAEIMKNYWYYFVWTTEVWNKIPDYIWNAFWEKYWTLVIHDRLPDRGDERLIFAFISDLAWDKVSPIASNRDFAQIPWLDWCVLWENNSWEDWTSNYWLLVDTNSWTVELHSKFSHFSEPLINDIRDCVFENNPEDQEATMDFINQMEILWYYLVGFSEKEWELPEYIIEAFNIKTDEDVKKFVFAKNLPDVQETFMIFLQIPNMPKCEAIQLDIEWNDYINFLVKNILKNMSIWIQWGDIKKFDTQKERLYVMWEEYDWVYFNPESREFELVYVNESTWDLTISRTSSLLKDNIDEQEILIEMRLEWYYFAWFTNENWEIQDYLKKQFNFWNHKDVKVIDYILHPRSPEIWKTKLIFIKWEFWEETDEQIAELLLILEEIRIAKKIVNWEELDELEIWHLENLQEKTKTRVRVLSNSWITYGNFITRKPTNKYRMLKNYY